MCELVLPPLLAADFWEIAIGIVFFVLYGIGQLISAREEAKKKPARPQKPRPPREPANNPHPPLAKVAEQPRNREEDLRNEVEEFLRRAQGRPAPQEQPQPKQLQPERPKQPVRRPVVKVEESLSKPKEAVSERKEAIPRGGAAAPKRKGPIKASPITNPAEDLRTDSISEHVAKDVDTKSFTEHADQLGDELELVDENLEARLHAKFDHQLGTLRHLESPTVANLQPNLAVEIADMLRNPEGVRQLIVGQEILRRPT